MKILDIKQRTDKWHQFRKKVIGASEAAAILGESPYKDARDVYYEKRGLAFPTPENAAMRAGNDAEPTILNAWNLTTGKIYEPTCGIHDTHDFIAASFDGYCKDDGSIIEIKYSQYPKLSRAMENIETFKREYLIYWIQVQHQMLVANVDKCNIVTISLKDGSLVSLTIKRDNDFIEQKLVPELIVFWNSYVLRGVEPPKSESTLPVLNDEDIVNKAKRIADLDAIEKKAKKEKELLKKELIEEGDDGDFIVGNILKLARSSKSITYDYRKACADLITEEDMEKYKKESIGTYRLTILKEKT